MPTDVISERPSSDKTIYEMRIETQRTRGVNPSWELFETATSQMCRMRLEPSDGSIVFETNDGVGGGWVAAGGVGGLLGDVVGPPGADDHEVAAYDGTTGKLLEGGSGVYADGNALSVHTTDNHEWLTLGGRFSLDQQTDPSTPPSGYSTLWISSGAGTGDAGDLLVMDDAGTIINLMDSGDVVGPASATDNEVPTFDGTTGKLIQAGSGVTIDGSGNITSPKFGLSSDANGGVFTVKNTAGSSVLLVAADASGDGYLNVKNSAGTSTISLDADSGSSFLNGNFGIGTTNPGAKLGVVGVDSSTIFEVSGASAIICQVGADASGDGYLYLKDSTGTNKILLDADGGSSFRNGNLGIGVNVASTELHVLSSRASESPPLKIEASGAGDASIYFNLTGVSSWSMGIDNSDSDKFKLANSGIGTQRH
jgi:hypothetical protein